MVELSKIFARRGNVKGHVNCTHTHTHTHIQTCKPTYQAMVELSKIFARRGNVKGACKLAARAAEIAPNDPDVACALAAAVCIHVCMYVHT